MTSTRSPTPLHVTHYENFPVASWLCPPHLRPAIAAIYGFARTADDIADEGNAIADERLTDLALYRHDLYAIATLSPHSGRWPQVFGPLQIVLHDFQLPVELLNQLLTAFEQDVRYTASGYRYQTDAELQDYCNRSANPVGRLLLHLYKINAAPLLEQSDLICSALQLINFWQDISVDAPHSRWYITAQAMNQFEVKEVDLQCDQSATNASKLIANYVVNARSMMLNGAPLCCQIPGRAGWELRLVVQGGLRILEKIESMNHETWRARPKLGPLDVPILFWRAWRMSAATTDTQA